MTGQRRKTHSDDLEPTEYVRQWANDLLAAVGEHEAQMLIKRYKAIAGDKRLSKYDRAVAEQRANILSQLVTKLLTVVD